MRAAAPSAASKRTLVPRTWARGSLDLDELVEAVSSVLDGLIRAELDETQSAVSRGSEPSPVAAWGRCRTAWTVAPGCGAG